MKRLAAAAAAVVASTACTGGERWGAPDAASQVDAAEPRRGGWDANSGNWNGNLGSWETVAGIGMNPDWAPAGTGPGTLTNAMVFGLQRLASPQLATCSAPTGGVDDVEFTSSAGTAAGALGPDVVLVRDGDRAPLAMGEEVVFAARAFDGYLRTIEVTARVRRVDTLVKTDALWYAWPVFELMICEHQRPHRGYVHLGYVSWAPMMTLPELPGEEFEFHDGIVMPITTVPRPEYDGDPDVPAVVQHQTGALWFKFAFYASLPIALHDEPELRFTTSAGRTIDNRELLRDGALALGNASWVVSQEEEDAGVAEAQQHRFPAFFTQDNTEVAMFAIARGDGATHGELRYPLAWGGQKIAALELTSAELALSASYSLDAVHGVATAGMMGALDRFARSPTHLASGPATFRVGRYLNGSPSRHRLRFAARRTRNLADTFWDSPLQAPIVGPISAEPLPPPGRASQARLQTLLIPATSPIEHLIAGESPRPPGKPDLNGGALVPPGGPPDGMVDAAPVDAAPVDAPPVDAPPVDAPTIDAPPVDAPPPDGPPVDAPAIDAPPPDGPPVDAPEPDAPEPDAGVDGGPFDAPDDAPIDAPADADADADIDGPVDAPSDGSG